jgi:hypothetical protein
MTTTQTFVRANLVGFFDSLADEEAKVRRYSVILHKNGAWLGDNKVGYVVSHLSIWDWCDMHGYQVVKLYINETRKARYNERTELF